MSEKYSHHYELNEGESAYLIFNDYMVTLDFFPGEPRIQVEDEEGELIQELNFDMKTGKLK